MALRRRTTDGIGGAIWPGFVDAMTAMLLVLTFVLSIFMITQYFLRETITGQEEDIEQKERALDTLSGRLDSLSDLLSLETTKKEKLAEQETRLRASLADLGTAKEAAEERIGTLTSSLAASEEGRSELTDQLASEQAALAREQAETKALEALAASLRAKAAADLEAAEAKIEQTSKALTREEMRRGLEAEAAEALRKRLTEADTEMTVLELELDRRRTEAEETLTLLAAAQAAGGTLTEERDAAADALTEKEALLKVARAELAQVSETTEEEQQQVALLNEQTRELRSQLKALEARLAVTESRRAAAEEESADQTIKLDNLGERLNAALAERTAALEAEQSALESEKIAQADLNVALEGEQKALAERNAALEEKRQLLEEQVDELSGFRSEFFGQVRKALGGRDEIQIVGDRFVFQSEVLFAPASAQLAEAGRAELAKLATILNEIAGDIPPDVNWILRIDGHTDKRPLRNSPRYRNNWELSQARALSVAEYLIREHGIAPARLAPTGFGSYQPLTDGDDARSLARNRRIELKLTER